MTPDVWRLAEVIIGVMCTVAIFSLVFRENAVYRLFEHIFIGVAAGYTIVVTVGEVIKPFFIEPVARGEWYWIMAVELGAMFYFVYSRKLNWISRIPIGLLMGMAGGMGFQAFANWVLPQVRESFKPIHPNHLNAMGEQIGWSGALNNLIFVVVLLTVMSYFFFSFEQKGRFIKGSARTGRLVLMVAFGAMFGATIMARLSLLFDRVYFVLKDAPAVIWTMLRP